MTDPEAPHSGQRGRIRRPAPPAPAPAPRTAPAARREESAPILNRPPTGASSPGGAAGAGPAAAGAGVGGGTALATGPDADAAPATATATASAKTGSGTASDADVVRSTGSMAIATLISRITGPTKGEIRIRGRVVSLLEIGTGFHQDRYILITDAAIHSQV